MRKSYLIFILFISLPFSSFSIVDTLRHYDPVFSDNTAPGGYDLYVSRFELPAPGYLKEVMVTLTGYTTGTVKMHLYGHEGGTSFPQLLNDLTPPIIIHKNQLGVQQIYVDLPGPVWFDNNQFFIAFSDFGFGVRLVSTTEAPVASCSSSSGGDYYYQFMFNSGSWYLGNKKSFKVDAIMDYPDLSSALIFQDVTASAGINTTLSNNSIATVDYDEDGYVDILVNGKLYGNLGNGQFMDKTQTAGLRGNPAANAFLDMDNDNDLDILFLDANDSSFIFLNDGNGYFVETYLPSLPVFKAIHSFSMADINLDNFPDFFVCQLWSTYPEPEPNYLFLNDSGLAFIDTTKMIYPDYDGTYNYPYASWIPASYVYEKNRNSRGSSWVDFDNDGDLDLFVTNYFLQQDEFYRNNGNGTFSDICVSKGIDHNPNGGSNHGTGVDWYDYDNDGDFDLLLPQFAHPGYLVAYDHRGTTIYRNQGPPSYSFFDTHGSSANADGDQGIEFEETHAGACWGDFNNDGLADFYISTYYGCRFVDVYIQHPDHTFSLKTFDYGIQNIVSGNDAVCFDYNRDGRLDLAAGDGDKIRIFENTDPDAGNSIFVMAHATSTNKYAIGAKVKIFVDGQVFTQEVNAGRGQKMQRPFTLHFGLGNHIQVDSAQVFWPGNLAPDTFTGLIVNNVNVLTEGGLVTYLGEHIDAAIVSFAEGTGCGFTSSEIITVQIANFGYDTISTFQIEYTLDSVSIYPETVAIPIAPGQAIDYSFNTLADFSGPGMHSLSVDIVCPNDSNLLNDHLDYYHITSTPELDLGDDMYVCEGESFSISTEVNFDFSSCLWSDGSWGLNMQSQNAGIYLLTITDMCGNEISDTIELIYYPVPQVDLGPDIYFFYGDTAVLDAGLWETYLWSNGETTQTIEVSDYGVYSVTITDANGCQNSDEVELLGLTSNPLVDLESQVYVYPNPGRGVFTVSADFVFKGNILLTVYTELGIQVISFRKENLPCQIDLSGYPKGIYFLQITSSNMSVVKKIHIE